MLPRNSTQVIFTTFCALAVVGMIASSARMLVRDRRAGDLIRDNMPTLDCASDASSQWQCWDLQSHF